jgi:hypothetical protein
MKILYLLHASFELPGVIESWASEKGHQQIYISTFKGEKIPPNSSLMGKKTKAQYLPSIGGTATSNLVGMP